MRSAVSNSTIKTIRNASKPPNRSSFFEDVPTSVSFQDTIFSNLPAPIKTRDAIGI